LIAVATDARNVTARFHRWLTSLFIAQSRSLSAIGGTLDSILGSSVAFALVALLALARGFSSRAPAAFDLDIGGKSTLFGLLPRATDL